MGLRLARFCGIFFTALALAPALAHLLELPHKIGLSRDDYLIVQQIYRGWALLGIVILAALLSTLILTILLHRRGKPFLAALIAFLCIVATQVVFWTFTFPTNQATSNWTMLPENWEALRTQWEYSHAASAVLNLLALIAVTLSVVRREDRSLR